MRDLDCWDALADPSCPEPELVDWLDQLAELPVADRWPFFARVEPWLTHASSEVRAAAFRAMTGAVGYPARVAIVAGLDDEDDAVRTAALAAFEEVGTSAALSWVHAVYHVRPDVRVGALQRMRPGASLPQWSCLPLLADPAAGPTMEARITEQGLVPESVDRLMQLMSRGADTFASTIVLKCLANLDWRHSLDETVKRFASERDPTLPKAVTLFEHVDEWAAAADKLDDVARTVIGGAAEGNSDAQWVIDQWLHRVASGGGLTDGERRLVTSLAVLAYMGISVAGTLAIVFAVHPTAVVWVSEEDSWAAFPVLARAARGGVPGTADIWNTTRRTSLAIEPDALAGMLRVSGLGAFDELLKRPDVPRRALVDALVADPAAGARLLAVPIDTRRDRTARRLLIAEAVAAYGTGAAALLAHVAVAVHFSDLGLVQARPTGFRADDQHELLVAVIAELVHLDREGLIRESRVRQLSENDAFSTLEVFRAVLEGGGSGALVHRWVSQALSTHGAIAVSTLSGAALERLVQLDREEAALPWALQQELARALSQHGHSGVAGWAAEVLAPVEVAMRSESRETPGRRLTASEILRIQSANPTRLPAALAPALTMRVRGLVEALGGRKPAVSIEACLALLLCGDRLESVARLFDDYSEPTDDFFKQLEVRAVRSYAHQAGVGIGMAAWLWRWDKPFARFVEWVTERPEELAFTLVRSLELPSPALRARVWQAARHLLGRWRWRSPEDLARGGDERLRNTVVGAFDGSPTGSSRSPRAYVATEVDFEEVTRVAAGMLEAMRGLGLPLEGHRAAVEARLGDLPPKTVKALERWLQVRAPIVTERPIVPAVAVPRGVESLEDIGSLIAIVLRGERGWAELASLRLLELGPPGERALVDALAQGGGRNPSVMGQAVATVGDVDAVDALHAALRDPSMPAVGRFYVAAAVADRGECGDEPRLVGVEALIAPREEGMRLIRSDTFDQWLDHLPAPHLPAVAVALVRSPHYPAHRWAVTSLIERNEAAEAHALETFLRIGRDRHLTLRVQAAEALARQGNSAGAPVLAARRFEQVQAKRTPVELAPDGTPEIAQAGMIAGSRVVDPAAVLAAVVVPSLRQRDRTASALAVLKQCDVEKVQRQALTHLDSRSHKFGVVNRLARLVVWGRDQARDLLDRDFGIQLIGGESLGYTRLEQKRIYVNPLALLRGERNGSAVVKGLIVHELGHHIYNADPSGLDVWKRAQDQGLQRLHNLVCDEHLERNLRAKKPSYDQALKRLCAWAFLHTRTDVHVLVLIGRLGLNVDRLIRTELRVARSPANVSVDLGGLFRQLESEGSSFARFARALRMGLGNRYDDPLVEQALALFDRSFRNLDNEGLWKITLRLQEIFGDQIPLMDLIDLHGTTEGGDGEGLVEGRGITDAEVQERADQLERLREAPPLGEGKGKGGPDAINVGDSVEFDTIDHIVVLAHDPVDHAEVAKDLRQPASQLRRALSQLGLVSMPVKPRTRGHRVDRGRLVHAALRRDPRMLVSRVRVPSTDLFIGVCVDCSGSMDGERLELAIQFATLLAEAVRGMGSVDLRVFGFTDAKLFDAGTAQRCAAHALESEGGNNDAAALLHVANLARRSARDAKLLVMISDGLPTQCSVNALQGLSRRLEREGMATAQIAVAPIREPCFDHYVEVVDLEPADAVRRFGRIAQNLVAATLRAR